MNNFKTLTTAIAFSTLGMVASGAIAQQSPSNQATAAQQQAQVKVSDKQLKQFVKARTQVNQIRREYSDKFSNAKDQQAAQKLQQSAQDEMLDAVKNSGLDAMTYNQLASRIQSDPELQQRAEKLK